ncbi:NADH dehydrogenase [Natronocella acetinitrilica]|uniref:NADH dehydrogenase n=1 Tax=Natronocella acetinitrilica TaxID=414046 RepID=A0AAE3KA27_9GAMM|nr:NAD-dependent epimerase/dehydratase family protein [Natronocella acetinitrilica]MCP1673685.1 NADH dehydrogenase [Natronocella acetinitrilica]
MQQPVVVFGGTGFLGRAVVAELVRRGWLVRVAARHPQVAALPGKPAGAVTRCAVDIRDEAAVATAVAGAAAVVNAVSLYVETRDVDFDTIHMHGAERIARLAAAAGVDRLVHISGIGVDTQSASRYVRARACGENAVRAAFPGATVLRPSVIFGPGDHFLSALDGVTRLPIVPLFGDGGTRLQPVHVEDVALAVAASLARPTAPGDVFELGGAEMPTYREILRLILRHRGRRRLLLPVPFAIWRGIARASALLPKPPITVDQVNLMAGDNVVRDDARSFADLGITPRGLSPELPDCMG